MMCCGKQFASHKGLKIHQTRWCIRNRGDSTHKTGEDFTQVANHSGIINASDYQQRREKIKWPKANDLSSWSKFEEAVLKNVKKGKTGQFTVDKDLERLAEGIYQTGLEEFGIMDKVKKKKNPIVISRRRKEIEKVKREKKNLRTQWIAANEGEKMALLQLYEDIKKRLRHLMRCERKLERRKKRKFTRSKFIENPFKFAKTLFQETRSGRLECTKDEMENHLKETYNDKERENELSDMKGIPKPTAPGVKYDLSELRSREVDDFLKKARWSSSPGGDGVPYKVYKKCSKLRNRLFSILKRAWQEKKVAQRWATAEGVYIPKEENSSRLDQFRPISLLNVDGKIFFGIISKRSMRFLLENGYIDETVQKAGIPGVPGCIEHATMIWDSLQNAKHEKKDLVVVWLDLANAFGSVPHKLLEYAMDMFWIPPEITKIMMDYYESFIMRFTTDDFTTAWQRLEVGIAAGCTISVIWFILAMEVILRGVKITDNEEDMYIEAPKKAFMDDVTLLTRKSSSMEAVLSRFDQLIIWARMKFKAKKSRSVTLVKGKQKECKYKIAGDTMPTVSEKPVKSLGRIYSGTLSDRHEGITIQEQAEEGLQKIDETPLPGKFKVWCLQFALYPRIEWPLTMYEVALSRVERIEQRCNVFIRKWLGLPRMTTSVALYNNKGPLKLPIPSIVDRYKCGKVRTVLMLRYSSDNGIRSAPPTVKTGRKWNAETETDECITSLKHGDIVGSTQTDNGGLGSKRFKPFAKMSYMERKEEVTNQVKKDEEDKRYVKLVQCSQQGQCVSWEEKVVDRKIGWAELWEWDQGRISFLLRSVYDVLPTPSNLKRWSISNDDKCRCGKLGTLRHILSNCPLGLERRYTWRHNLVLRVLSEAVQKKVSEINSGKRPKIKNPKKITFCKEGQAASRSVPMIDDPKWKGNWEVSMDLDGKFFFPIATKKRPDMVLWCEERKVIKLIELTVPWESNIDDAWYRKDLKYDSLVDLCEDNGWEASCHPIEVGVRGFIGRRVFSLLRELGFQNKEQKAIVKEIQERVEKASYYIWLKRNDENWTEKA